ncbi:hypothetical protein [Chromobacterium violaceum]|uniref:hypothetical protein n=1 Tax=Chromobacterium violaceum TaxID=536 RepID=UPI001B34013F|nr:hypothetical protein [Chromobacterium violaceum]MBP4045095.1 hypothetical protein [Chromobacterium violaceum]
MNQKKPIAKSKFAGKTDGIEGSLLRCEVNANAGEWVKPSSCEKFHITTDAKLPKIEFEFKTNSPPPYDLEWSIRWIVQSCKQAKNKPRFKPKHSKTYTLQGKSKLNDKKWIAGLDGQVVGGELTVNIKAGEDNFRRTVFILGTEPGKELVSAYLDSTPDKDLAGLVKKIFKQETNFTHFYTDEMPLVSFDNGYGLGQATNPIPTYEQVWNWKKHADNVLSIVKSKRNSAKKYLSQDNRSYTQDQLDLETLAFYNGANYHYHVWDGKSKSWVVNPDIVCDPKESNKGWDVTKEENRGKSVEDLRKNKKSKPIYTGRCYAEHVNNAQ